MLHKWASVTVPQQNGAHGSWDSFHMPHVLLIFPQHLKKWKASSAHRPYKNGWRGAASQPTLGDGIPLDVVGPPSIPRLLRGLVPAHGSGGCVHADRFKSLPWPGSFSYTSLSWPLKVCNLRTWILSLRSPACPLHRVPLCDGHTTRWLDASLPVTTRPTSRHRQSLVPAKLPNLLTPDPPRPCSSAPVPPPWSKHHLPGLLQRFPTHSPTAFSFPIHFPHWLGSFFFPEMFQA